MSWYTPIKKDASTLGPLKTWSFSGLKEFEQCAFKRFTNKVRGFRSEAGEAATRGSHYHECIEKYILGDMNTLPKMKDAPRQFIETLREAYDDGNIVLEEPWFINMDWKKCTKEEMWAVFIIDCMIWESETSAHAIDWKTGRSRNNEMKHGEQLMFYAACAFSRYPKLEYLTVSAWYIDEGFEGCIKSFTREQIERVKPSITARAMTMTTATDFPPNPSQYNCKWCDYKTMKDENGKPLCEWGVI